MPKQGPRQESRDTTRGGEVVVVVEVVRRKGGGRGESDNLTLRIRDSWIKISHQTDTQWLSTSSHRIMSKIQDDNDDDKRIFWCSQRYGYNDSIVIEEYSI